MRAFLTVPTVRPRPAGFRGRRRRSVDDPSRTRACRAWRGRSRSSPRPEPESAVDGTVTPEHLAALRVERDQQCAGARRGRAEHHVVLRHEHDVADLRGDPAALPRSGGLATALGFRHLSRSTAYVVLARTSPSPRSRGCRIRLRARETKPSRGCSTTRTRRGSAAARGSLAARRPIGTNPARPRNGSSNR